jgi:hypothetical protein
MTNQNIANVVVAVLKEVEMDGEMMEWIINQVGMRDQMVKQLITNKQELNTGIVAAAFTKDSLIEYTREIQSRALEAAKEAVKGSGVDIESYISLDLYDREIQIEVDEDNIYSEINSSIEDAFETDDDSVFDEATNVIMFMKKV